MAIAGIRGTGDWGTDERPKSFREAILWRNPNGTAPIQALLGRAKSEGLSDPEFAWWEEKRQILRLTMINTTTLTSGITTVPVSSEMTDALDAVPGDLFQVEKAIVTGYDNEIIMVSSVTSASVIEFKRGQVGSTAGNIVLNDKLTKIGNMFEEGSSSADATSRNPTKLYNYSQIFKTTYQLSNTAKNTRVRTGDPLQVDKARRMDDHAKMLEMAILFGRRFEGTGSGGKPIRSSGGILHMMSIYNPTSIVPFTTTPTETTFTDAVYPVFDYDSSAGNERVVFAGNGALNSLNRLANASTNARLKFDGIIKFFGMDLQRWVLPQGTLLIKSHPLFNVHGRYANDMLVLDPTSIKLRHMRQTRFKDNIQPNDADYLKGEWLTEEGFEFHHLETSRWLSNFVV